MSIGVRTGRGRLVKLVGVGVVLSALGLALSTCRRSPKSVELKKVWVEVGDTTVELDQSADGVIIALPVTIVNDGGDTVWYQGCGSELERRIASDWAVVWNSVCALGELDDVSIRAGEVLSTVVLIRAALGAAQSRHWLAPIEGQYRLTVAMRGEEDNLPGATSDPFQLRIGD